MHFFQGKAGKHFAFFGRCAVHEGINPCHMHLYLNSYLGKNN